MSASLTHEQVVSACAEEAAHWYQMSGPVLAAFLTATPGSLAHDILEAHFREHRLPYSTSNRRDAAVELATAIAKDLAESIGFDESALIEIRLAANGIT